MISLIQSRSVHSNTLLGRREMECKIIQVMESAQSMQNGTDTKEIIDHNTWSLWWSICYCTFNKSRYHLAPVQQKKSSLSRMVGHPWLTWCLTSRTWQAVKVHGRQKTRKNGPMRYLARRSITHLSWRQDAENRKMWGRRIWSDRYSAAGTGPTGSMWRHFTELFLVSLYSRTMRI